MALPIIDYYELEKTARPGAFSRFDMEALGPYLQKLLPNEIYLEIGVDKGRSLDFARRVTDPATIVCGVDLKNDPEVPGTKFYQGYSKDIARTWRWELTMWRVSLLFVDGDHSYLGCRTDIEEWLPNMKKGATIFFHDCDETSPGVMEAVDEFMKKYKISEFYSYKTPERNTSMVRITLLDRHYEIWGEEET